MTDRRKEGCVPGANTAEIDVESATSGTFASLFKSYDFGVLYAFVSVRAFAGFLAGGIDDDGADCGIG